MLNQKQQKCLFLMVTTNKTQKEISNDINISENSICEWKKNQEFINELHRQTKENFSFLAIEAQKELRKLLKSKNEYIKLQAIKDILDRAGFKQIEKTDLMCEYNVQIIDDIVE